MDNITSRTNFLNKELVDNIAQYDLGSFFQDGYDFGKESYRLSDIPNFSHCSIGKLFFMVCR